MLNKEKNKQTNKNKSSGSNLVFLAVSSAAILNAEKTLGTRLLQASEVASETSGQAFPITLNLVPRVFPSFNWDSGERPGADPGIFDIGGVQMQIHRSLNVIGNFYR